MSTKVNRRSFIGIGAAFAAAGCQSNKGGCPAITSTRSPNSLVRHLSIGCGNRAWGDVNELCTHPSVEMAAFCDVDLEFLTRAKNTFPKARFYRDWREMYEKEFDSCDSVCVGAPDHHHVAMATAAMKAGKHVYLEKPMAKTMVEAKFLRDVAAEAGVVTQMGTQYNAYASDRQVVAMLRKKALGPVEHVYLYPPSSHAEDRARTEVSRLGSLARQCGGASVCGRRVPSAHLAHLARSGKRLDRGHRMPPHRRRVARHGLGHYAREIRMGRDDNGRR